MIESSSNKEYLSNKVKALSLVAIILVVFIHSYNAEIKFASGVLSGGNSHSVMFVQNFFSKGIGRIAVPFFFLISGFHFYSRLNFSFDGIIDKYKKRFKTLVIPYLFWSVFGVILFFFMQSIPLSKTFFTKELIKDYSFTQLLETILVDPIPYQLWFVRDLIMLVVFSPLIGYITKSTKGVWIIFLVILWFVAPKTFELFSNESLLFFTAGCFFAFDKSQPLANQSISKYSRYFLVTWLLMVTLTTYLLTFEGESPFLDMLNKTGTFIGILSVWSSYDLLNLKQTTRYSALFAYSFIIYVFHEPLLTILIKGMFYMWGKTDGTALLVYLLAPLLAIGVCISVRFLWKRYAPGFYDLATGGR